MVVGGKRMNIALKGEQLQMICFEYSVSEIMTTPFPSQLPHVCSVHTIELYAILSYPSSSFVIFTDS